MKFAEIIIVSAIAAGCAILPVRADERQDELPDCKRPLQNFMLDTVASALKWKVPADPVHIAGPIYFVGTEGLGAYLIKTPAGHILLNTGMPGSGPMIEAAIKKIENTRPEDIKWLVANHAHVDHVGGHAYFKDTFPDIKIAIGDADRQLLESGGATDFHYRGCPGFQFTPVRPIGRTLKDGDTIDIDHFSLKAIHTPGHTKGSTTFVIDVEDAGKPYRVVFLDGTRVNPGYKVGPRKQSYPTITRDFDSTFRHLIALSPSIWLTPHTADFDFKGKRTSAKTEGAEAWVDRKAYKGYKCFVAKQWLKFALRAKRDAAEATQQALRYCSAP